MIRGCWFETPARVGAILHAAEAHGYAPAELGSSGRVVQEVRKSGRAMIDDPDLAAWFLAHVAEVPGLATADDPDNGAAMALHSVNPRMRVLRYGPGDYFRRHKDGVYVSPSRELGVRTLLVYLSRPTEYVGGETVVDGYGAVRGGLGEAVVFDHDLVHEGAPVQSGVKIVLRTDIMYKHLELGDIFDDGDKYDSLAFQDAR